ncbi:MAG TPA: hypothetical protein VK208_05860 [Pyrinomonadaceae bacterium]|jgi:hypothetical protein|nr:hypothetical protein [Pyrinomonadaceae bacterium]
MAIQVIINQVGPLPITANFSAPGDEPMYLEINGSVWSQVANVMLGITIELDGQAVGTAQIFSNGNATHRAVVPAYIPIQLSQGQHTLSLSRAPGSTVSDSNDSFTAVIHF